MWQLLKRANKQLASLKEMWVCLVALSHDKLHAINDASA